MPVLKIENESDLREWLRDGWKQAWGELIWAEAARGGTNGAPDVFVPTQLFGYIPVELKFWKTSSRGRVLPYLRPSQKRLHKLIRYSNQRSAILAAYRSSVFVGDSLPFVERSMVTRLSGMRECTTALDLLCCLQSSSLWEEHWKRSGRI